MLINICSQRLPESRDFYCGLFDFAIDYDSDWFVHLISRDKSLELGIIDINHDLVPVEIKKQAAGSYLTFVVDDVDKVYELVQSEGFKMIQSPKDTFYGQRRMLIEDPNGFMIDVSSPVKGG